jgi:hypothetical protein
MGYARFLAQAICHQALGNAAEAMREQKSVGVCQTMGRRDDDLAFPDGKCDRQGDQRGRDPHWAGIKEA